MCMRRPAVNLGYGSGVLSTLFFETKFLIEPKLTELSIDWQAASPRYPPASCLPNTEIIYEHHHARLSFAQLLGSGDWIRVPCLHSKPFTE